MSSNLIKVKAKNTHIALIIRSNLKPKPHQFLTDDDSPLQLGILNFKKNTCVEPHQHLSLTKTTHQNQEFIYLVKGKIKASFYFNQKLIATHILKSGDCLLQLAGGHGFSFLKPSKIITIKQGPYKGTKKEKQVIK